jgi:phosphatidylserine synthase
MSKSKKSGSSQGLVGVVIGLVFCALGAVHLLYFGASDAEPLAGRTQFFSTLGLPVGIIVLVVGVVMMVRERRR